MLICIYIYVILYSISILYDACVSAICMIYEQIYDMISLVSWFGTHKFFHLTRQPPVKAVEDGLLTWRITRSSKVSGMGK